MNFNRKSMFWLVIVFSMVFAFIGCGGSGGGGAADTTPPTVTSTSPVDGATDVPVDAALSATFSENLDAATVDSGSFTLSGPGGPVTGTISYDPATMTGTFTPDLDLVYDTAYTGTLTTTITDVAGNPMTAVYSISFTTAAAPDTIAPTVSSTTPGSGATGVAIGTTVNATFDEAMDAATIDTASFTLFDGATPITGTVTYAGNTATFTPGADLVFSTTYTATVTTAVADTAGNTMASDAIWSFTTAAVPDTTPPTVDGVTPNNGATDAVVGGNVTATFNETMTAGSITTSSFTLTGPGGPVSGAVSYAGTTASFNPDANLASETTYTATITTAVTDVAGNGLASNFVWTFTTEDAAAPTVSSTNPANSGTDVAITANVTATFSEAMNAATISDTSFILSVDGGAAVTGVVTYTGTTATFNPDADLTNSTTYRATITTAATDAAGNALASNFEWTFTTEADTTAPTVDSVTPVASATDVAVGDNLTATFSEAMNAATITTSSFTLAIDGGAAVTGVVTYTGTTATFNPDADLTNSTTYRATITTAATDAAGNALASNFEWTFTTEADTTAPTVDSTVPVDSATDVLFGDNVTATFSEAMNAATITATSFTLAVEGGAAVTGAVTYTGTTATFDPVANLANNTTYRATITTAATDAAGNALASNFTWTFTTLNDSTAPTVNSVTPADTTTNVGVATNVTATFSEAMAAATITTSNLTLEVSGGAAVAGAVTYDSASNTATFDPTNNLANSTTYDATITTAVTDEAGNALASTYTWSFTTAAQAPGNWSWVGGTNTAGTAGVYGTQGTPAPTNMPGARIYAASWTDSSGGFWLFGGRGFDVFGTLGELNDLWYFDGAEWTWVAGSSVANQTGVYGTQGTAAPGNTPGNRRNPAFCIDAADNLWLFGGRNDLGNEHVDMWRFDGTSWAWISGSQSTNLAGIYTGDPADLNPGSRSNAVLGTAANGVDLYMFGGTGWDGVVSSIEDSGELNDLWMYDVSEDAWLFLKGSDTENQLGIYGTQGIAAAANTPGARRKPNAWTDSAGNLWIFGGIGSDSVTQADEGLRAPRLNDLWVFNGTDWAWMKGSDVADQWGVYSDADPANDTPGARYFGTGWIDGSDNLYLFGGRGYDGGTNDYDDRLNDLWMYDGTNWSWVSGSDTNDQPDVYSDPDPSNIGPGARSALTGWLDSTGNIWLFGGANDSGYLNDMWVYIPVP